MFSADQQASVLSAARILSSLVSTAPYRIRSHSFVPHQAVGETKRPDIYMPYTAKLSPHLDAARKATVEWGERMGLLDGTVWDAGMIADIDLPLCAAGIHPDASPEELNLSSQWLAWGTYADDYYPIVFGRTRNLAGAKATTARLSEFMPVDSTVTPVPATALERSLADLWSRTAGPMTRENRQAFKHAIDTMTDSWLWELANQFQNRIPDPVDYIEMRRRTFGSDLTMSLCRIGHGRTVPPEIYRSRPIQAMENSAADYACLLNDVFSYQKEIQFEGEFHNGVMVVQNFLGCDKDQALYLVNELMTARMRQFQQLVAVDLPVLFDDFGLDDDARRTLTGYAEELQNWMSGILVWHEGCRRYDEPTLQRNAVRSVTPASPAVRTRVLGGASGLGTSAARIHDRRSQLVGARRTDGAL